ncbi:hypothetical protein Mpsy_1531 [Methanolobus psychrophilus R15]|nr:hypothetical protein Mpsy_1531 [Methanolobus psychrophilus R15]
MIDEKGQIAVDFLLGISLFLIALMFIVQFIPGLFLPGSANEGSLDHTAYRTATVLAEDPGWWGNTTTSNTDWEHNPADVKRIGLAADDDSSSKLTNSPNLISKNKTLAMMQIDEKVFVEKLGLYDNVNEALFYYGYNISITKNITDSASLVLENVPLARGSMIPADRDVIKIVRIVLIETGKVAYFDADEFITPYPTPSNMTSLSVAGPKNEDVTVIISKFNITGTNPKLESIELNGTTLAPSSDFNAYKRINGIYSPINLSESLECNDMLRLDLNSSLFSANQTYLLELTFNDIWFTMSGAPLEYTSREEAFYEPAYLNVMVWK